MLRAAPLPPPPPPRVMSLGGILFWVKCRGAFDGFVDDKEESSLELVMPPPLKVRDPFLWLRKKLDPALSLQVGR